MRLKSVLRSGGHGTSERGDQRWPVLDGQLQALLGSRREAAG